LILLTSVLVAAPTALPLAAQTDGERAWRAGYDAALVGRADASLAAYAEALRLARQDRDQELASAARLGMAEVWDVWRRCPDSARAAYQDAVALSAEGDYAAADAFVLWLARQGNHAEARRLHARAYLPIENDVPRSVTRESVNFLIALAAIQVANQSRSGAMVSLTSARDIADRLTVGDQQGAAAGGVTVANYWALHDIAALQLDPASGTVRNAVAGRALQQRVDAATATVSDNGANPRFAVGRLADRVARTRRTCREASCQLPPPPAVPRCR
jgi:tetratricopeptide (TPR) repeat protein